MEHVNGIFKGDETLHSMLAEVHYYKSLITIASDGERSKAGHEKAIDELKKSIELNPDLDKAKSMLKTFEFPDSFAAVISKTLIYSHPT